MVNVKVKKVTDMGIFTGRYSFGLNVAQDTNVVRDNILFPDMIFVGNRLSS